MVNNNVLALSEFLDQSKTPLLSLSINTLDFSIRTSNCLRKLGVKCIGDLAIKTDTELLKTKNFGRKCLNEVKECLATMGLKLGMKIPDERQLEFPPDDN